MKHGWICFSMAQMTSELLLKDSCKTDVVLESGKERGENAAFVSQCQGTSLAGSLSHFESNE